MLERLTLLMSANLKFNIDLVHSGRVSTRPTKVVIHSADVTGVAFRKTEDGPMIFVPWTSIQSIMQVE